MKFTDDYNAKYVIWARESRVYALPRITGLPHFGSKKFSSYEDLNRWKRALLLDAAATGSIRWTP